MDLGLNTLDRLTLLSDRLQIDPSDFRVTSIKLAEDAQSGVRISRIRIDKLFSNNVKKTASLTYDVPEDLADLVFEATQKTTGIIGIGIGIDQSWRIDADSYQFLTAISAPLESVLDLRDDNCVGVVRYVRDNFFQASQKKTFVPNPFIRSDLLDRIHEVRSELRDLLKELEAVNEAEEWVFEKRDLVSLMKQTLIQLGDGDDAPKNIVSDVPRSGKKVAENIASIEKVSSSSKKIVASVHEIFELILSWF